MLRPPGRRHTRGMSLIVVATDGSPAAGAALDEAIRLAQATGDTVAVLAVWRALQGDFGLPYPSAALLGELLDAEHAYAERMLAEARGRAIAAGVEVETVLQAGDPAERICAFAEEREARLIAIGTHGYRPALALLTGSVSTAVIRRAPCPVLVVREPETEAVSAASDRLAANG
jgi:nucleotide-binding universal stress UspA family protein